MDKIRQWLASQGYPFEIRIGRTCSQCGWAVSHATLYSDPQTTKQRQIDLVLSLRGPAVEYDFWRFRFGVTYVAELKARTDKPWAVFSSPFTDDSIDARPADSLTPGGSGRDLARIALHASPKLGFLRPGPVAHAAVQTLVDRDVNPAYLAIQSAISGTVALARENRPSWEEPTHPSSEEIEEAERMLPEEQKEIALMYDDFAHDLTLFLPLVIIGDDLLECVVTEDDPPSTKPIPVAHVLSPSQHAGTPGLLVTVLQAEHVAPFLRGAERDFERLLQLAEPRLPQVVDKYR